jgi:hypothetical protein
LGCRENFSEHKGGLMARTRSAPNNRYGSAYDQANAAAFERENEIRGIFDDIVGTYAPGGSYLKGAEAMIDRQKQKYVGSATQNLISSGLFGSTMTAGLPGKFEEEIGMPSRLKLEDMRTQAYTGALGQKASFIERIEEQVPDYGLMANLTAQAQQPQQSLSSWLAETFGGTGPSAPSGPSEAAIANEAANRRAAEELARRRAAYSSSAYSSGATAATAEAPFINTEEARDARKQAGYYLDSSGKLVKT